MIENEQPELCARVDAMQFLLRTLIQRTEAAERERLRETFDGNLAKWRELLIMSRASAAYLSALEAEIEAWRARFLAADRDEQPPL